MGQAWCKEKTSKAQDSKSPLDRVFVRCAHRIYPSWKEEGSVLGGATQRVTSSEIGYAGSPPREVLTRGRSIDSVDRPFHPSDWVDVNLEVPSTPRASSVLTNLTVDTSLYPATTPTSSCSNLKDATPVPPPRRRKRNRGRPLPPKPDEVTPNAAGNPRKAERSEEPLYSSVKSPKSSGDEHENDEEARNGKSSVLPDAAKHEVKRAKEIYEHKVNGTGRIISSDVVSGKRTSCHEDRKGRRNVEAGQPQRRGNENEEYEKFVRNQSVKDSSTPNRHDRRKSKDHEKQIKDPSSREPEKVETRTKNYSTVSLPNYDELEVARHAIKRSNDQGDGGGEKTKSRRPVRSSTGSLPAESFLSPFSEKTSVRLEDYIPRRGSIENLSAYQVLGKLDRAENGAEDGVFVKYDPSKLEDWDLGDIGNCELNHQRRRRRPSVEGHPAGATSPQETSSRNDDEAEEEEEEEDVVDFSRSNEIGDNEGRFLGGREISDRNATGSPVALQKPEAFGKSPSPILDEGENSRTREDEDWILGQNRSHLRYFEPPTLAETCKDSTACESKLVPREPFFLDEAKHRSALDTIGGSGRDSGSPADSDRSRQSRMIFGRSLSNESEPNEESYESKDLRCHRQGIAVASLVRTISEESLPREMAEVVEPEPEDILEEKTAKDALNKMRKDCVQGTAIVKTPPPSPEPKIKAEILDNDHSTLLKVLKEEAEGSNLSSMTPSLTELEAALSDMLEKEEPHEETRSHDSKPEESKGYVERSPVEKPIEPEIVPVEKNPSSFADTTRNDGETNSKSIEAPTSPFDETVVVERIEEQAVSLGQILEGSKSPIKTRKVSFCAWEEYRAHEDELGDDREFIGQPEKDLDKKDVSQTAESNVPGEEDARNYLADIPPEKPSRLHRNLEDLLENVEFVPTPPRRKNKGSSGVATAPRKEIETAQNGSAIADPYLNDRLI